MHTEGARNIRQKKKRAFGLIALTLTVTDEPLKKTALEIISIIQGDSSGCGFGLA